jgi:hypothetical protein
MSELRLEIEELEQRIAPDFLLGVTPPGNPIQDIKPGAEVCLPEAARSGINTASAGGVVFVGPDCGCVGGDCPV